MKPSRLRFLTLTGPENRSMIPEDLTSRAGLSRAITLAESSRRDHQLAARRLISQIMPLTGKACRLGVTGVPGVGKSTFIDTFGSLLTSRGMRVAVLAIDPTSRRSGGSILGDKTRMANLSMDPRAFIRPSPAGDTLGGAAARTREAMLLCEAAGFDVVIVETVGVGQSETMVSDMVDILLALMLPNAGDELQGIKKGILEVVDILAVNKCDLDRKAAERARSGYETALHLMAPADGAAPAPVRLISAQTGEGLDELWDLTVRMRAAADTSGRLQRRRALQQVRWLEALVAEGLQRRFEADPRVTACLKDVRKDVEEGRTPASAAADYLLSLTDEPARAPDEPSSFPG
jgi:LAO/AO transport system kinase